MDTGIDRTLVGRVVAFIAGHVRDGVIPQARLQRAYQLTGVDANHQRAVEAGLREMGVAVELPAPVGNTSSSTSAADAGNEFSAEPAVPAAAANTPRTSIDRANAIHAARLLLTGDRRRRRIDRRILTAEEEVGLSLLFRGNMAPDAPLPSGFRAHLAEGSEQARAFDALVLHNQRLVWSVACKQTRGDLELDEVVQSGYEGLIRAAEKFDPSSGHKFSTYATWWLRQSMSRAVANEGRCIRIPVHMYERVQKVMRLYGRIQTQEGHVTLADVAARADLTAEQTVECLRLAAGVVSLDVPVADGDVTLNELVAVADGESGPEAALDRQATSAAIARALRGLSDREALVMTMRHGLPGDEPATLETIGKTLGITRERVRQIESNTLPKMRRALHYEGYGPCPEKPRSWSLNKCMSEARSLPHDNLRQRARHLFGTEGDPRLFSLVEESARSSRAAEELAIVYGVAGYIARSQGTDKVADVLQSTPPGLGGRTITDALLRNLNSSIDISRPLAAVRSLVEHHETRAAA